MKQIASDEVTNVSRCNQLTAVGALPGAGPIHCARNGTSATGTCLLHLNGPVVWCDEAFDGIAHFQEAHLTREREARGTDRLIRGLTQESFDGRNEIHRHTSDIASYIATVRKKRPAGKPGIS